MGEVSRRDQEIAETKDVSAEFLDMSPFVFYDFLRRLRKEPELSIMIDWQGPETAIRLKAFLEDAPEGQKRSAAI